MSLTAVLVVQRSSKINSIVRYVSYDKPPTSKVKPDSHGVALYSEHSSTTSMTMYEVFMKVFNFFLTPQTITSYRLCMSWGRGCTDV